MLVHTVRRIGLLVPTLIGVTIVVFLMLKLVPGDPVNAVLGVGASAADRARVTAELGLDRPWWIQYIDWISQVLRGDLGESVTQKVAVSDLLFGALGYTLVLTVAAGIWSFALAAFVGTYSAYRPKSVVAAIGSGISAVALSVPVFWAALILIALFSVQLGWLPASGTHAIGDEGVSDFLRHLAMPAFASGLTTLGIMTRMVRSTVHGILQLDFVSNLRAKGVSEWVVLRHVMANAIPSLLTVAGLQVGYLLGGSVLVETVFTWPGVGLLIYQAINQRDFPVIQSGILIVSLLFVIINVLVDIAHTVVDPRVKAA